MSEARAQILGSIRRSLGRDSIPGDRLSVLKARVQAPPEGLIPDRTNRPPRELITLFKEMARKVQTTIADIESLADIPDAVADYLAGENLPAALRAAPHRDLEAVPWSKRPTLSVDSGPSDGNQAVGLSAAFAGIAETGTLCLLSGQEGPTTLNFLPETHIVLLRESDMAGSYEQVWNRLRQTMPKTQDGAPSLPRTVNLITGPSRTGDIEQTIELGAHGPLRLHILLLKDSDAG